MKKIIGIMLLLGMGVINAWAVPQLLSVNEVSASNLKIILSEKYGTSIDENGLLLVKRGDAQTIAIIINQENKSITFVNAWIAKPSAPKEKCFALTNNWLKDQSMFGVVYDSENKRFIRAYVMSFKGGIIVENLLIMLEEYLADDEALVKHLFEAGVLEQNMPEN